MDYSYAKPIRVLIVNSYEYPSNLLADSSFTLTKSIIKAMPPDRFYFTWVLPEFDLPIPKQYRITDTLDLPGNVSILQVPMFRFRVLSEMLLCEELFMRINPVSGRCCAYDLVITNNPNIAGKLADWFASVMYKNISGYVPNDPPIVIVDYSTPFYGNDSECAYAKWYPNKLRSMYLGYSVSKASFFFTQYCYNRATEQYRKFFSASEAYQFSERSHIFHGIFSQSEIPVTPVEKNEVFSIYWGGRLAGGKKVKLIVEMANTLHKTGRHVKMVMTLPDKKSYEAFRSQVPKNYGDIFEIHFDLSQKDAFEVMRRCHASIFAQSMRFGPAAPLEQLYSGLVLLPYRRESADILPDEYPYYWTERQDLLAHLFDIYDYYEDACEKVRPFCNSIANTHSVEGNISILSEEIERIVEEQDRRIVEVVLPSSGLLRGRIDELRHMTAKQSMTLSSYIDWVLSAHRVYSVLRTEINPFYLNASFWMLYKALRIHVPVNLLRDDPVFYVTERTKNAKQ